MCANQNEAGIHRIKHVPGPRHQRGDKERQEEHLNRERETKTRREGVPTYSNEVKIGR